MRGAVRGVRGFVRLAAGCGVMLAGTGIAGAQTSDLVTDRPDSTESATVVGRGLVQVETGYLFASTDDVGGYEVPGTLVRVGLGGRTELRLGHGGVVGSEGRHGWSDSTLGIKVNLIEQADGWRPELAVLGGLSLPTGETGFSSDGVDPSFLVVFAHEVSERVSVGYNLGAAWESSPEQADRDAAVVYSLAVGIGLTERLGTFVELFGDQPAREQIDAGLSLDGGFTVLLTPLVQLDVFVGTGLHGSVDDVFVGTGLSFRLPR
ncbi:MAG: transporter [Vicinamibacterales bacterium]|nr:hypothetical protein [Acidobacteriota bacterium]MDP7295478.1 transporter [Vicinamibacterales bacterium]MDP7471195.1 transporter [Vicinamibacterales bacterium]MDP7671689.1 transporter [Vicinamibacterales bacterium]HJO39162.1 transporter [Vicinamibacterales bacterium]